MAKSKWETNVKDKLLLVEALTGNGLTLDNAKLNIKALVEI